MTWHFLGEMRGLSPSSVCLLPSKIVVMASLGLLYRDIEKGSAFLQTKISWCHCTNSAIISVLRMSLAYMSSFWSRDRDPCMAKHLGKIAPVLPLSGSSHSHSLKDAEEVRVKRVYGHIIRAVWGRSGEWSACLSSARGKRCTSLVPLAAARAEQQAWARARTALGKSCQRFTRRWVTIWALLRLKALRGGTSESPAAGWQSEHTAFGAGWAPLLGSGSTVCRAAGSAGTELQPSPQPLALLWCPRISGPFRQTWHAGSQQMNRAERCETGNASQTETCGLCLVHSNTGAIPHFAGGLVIFFFWSAKLLFYQHWNVSLTTVCSSPL